MGSRAIWKGAAAVVLLGAILAAAGTGGVYVYLERRNQAWLTEAKAAYAGGEWEIAKGKFERYLPQDPSNVELLKKYADACLRIPRDRMANLQAAGTAYQQIVTYHPDDVETKQQLVELYKKMGAWATLEYYTNLWAAQHPEVESFRYHRALALERLGNRDDAVKAYEELVNADTDYSEAYGSLAQLYRDLRLDAQAADVFTKALERRGDDARIKVDYARFLARTRNWDRIEALMAEAQALAPDDPYVLTAAAQAAIVRRDYAQGLELLARAVEIDPASASAQLMLAAVLVNQDRVRDAVERLRSIDPVLQADAPLIPITLADLQLELREFDAADKTIRAYNAMFPDQLPIMEYFEAKKLLVRGEPEAASERLAPVVELRPAFLLAQYTLAVAYLEAGERALARNALEMYLSRNPGDERAQRLMAQHFGRPLSASDLALRAREALTGTSARPPQLVATASALLEAAIAAGDLDGQLDLVEDLFEKAIQADSSDSSAYLGLIDALAAASRLEEAEAVVKRAEASGVPPVKLRTARGLIALARGETEQANRLFDEEVSAPTFTQSDAVRWAKLLAARGYSAVAFDLLTKAAARMEKGEARAGIEIERLALAVQERKSREAFEWIGEVERHVAKDSLLRKRFNAVRLNLAQDLLVSGSSESRADAESIVAQVRAEDPENPTLLSTDGLVALQATPPQLDAAEQLFERALAEDENNLSARWGLARISIAKGDYVAALRHAQEGAALAPRSTSIQLALAEALLRLGRSSESEAVLSELLKRDPNNKAANVMLLESLLDRGETGTAGEVLARLESLAKDDPELDIQMRAMEARVLVQQGRSGDAERILRERIGRVPDDFSAHRDLAALLRREGRTEEGRTLLEAFAARRRDDPWAWVAVADFELAADRADRLQRASTLLMRALLADPNHLPALRGLVNVRMLQGDRTAALGLCERYLDLEPEDSQFHNIKALLLCDVPGKLEEALASVDRALQLEALPEYQITRGIILIAMKDYERALQTLRPLASGAAETGARLDAALAEAYLGVNDLELARRYYESARSKIERGDPLDRRVLDRLDSALAQREATA